MPRLLVVGHGRMGTLVEALAPEEGFELVGIVSGRSAAALTDIGMGAVDVAIDFTTADAVRRNLTVLATRGINVVIGTTGWHAVEPELQAVVAGAGIGVVAAANFSLGMNVFQLIVEEAARRFSPRADFGAWIHEAHHDRKKDAPSGTAIALKTGMGRAGFSRNIDMSSTRVGFIPGTHTVGFDGPSETIELTHTVRDRGVFARGALVAAKWVIGRRGWFSMRDVLA
jgi:4-hydroxy-tetrahydrodipicolinate reductase